MVGAVSQEWQPLGMSDEESANYEVLVDGVPGWLREPLLLWIAEVLRSPKDPRLLSTSALSGAQSALRVTLFEGLPTSNGWIPSTATWQHVTALSPLDLLRLADWLLAHEPRGPFKGYAASPTDLEQTLAAARSKWRVEGGAGGLWRLVERVPEGVRLAVEDTVAKLGDAGRVLARAWYRVHAMTPDPPGAYADVVKVVENASVPRVVPNNTSATLGHVLGEMKANGDWRLPLREHAEAPGPEMVLMMLRTLWFGHRDRHGGVNYADVTQEEARSAVTLGATLVDWFGSGTLTRRSR